MNYVVAAQPIKPRTEGSPIFKLGLARLAGGGFQPSLVVQWDPVAGTSTLRHDEGGGGLVSMSADHSKILIGAKGYRNFTIPRKTLSPRADRRIRTAMNPAGTQFLSSEGLADPVLQLANANLGTVDLPLCCGLAPFGGVYSPDGGISM